MAHFGMNDSRELTHLNIIVLVAGGGAEIAIQEYQLPRVLDIGRIRLAISFRGTQPRFSLSSPRREGRVRADSAL